MELIEGDDMKRDLLRKSARHKEQIEGNVRFIGESTEKAITNALVIGGTLAVTYFLVSQLTSGSEKKTKRKATKLQVVQAKPVEVGEVVHESESPGLMGQVGAALVSQASAFLLNLAKEKLMEYLAEKAQQKTQE